MLFDYTPRRAERKCNLTFPDDVIKYLYDFWIPVRRARRIDRSHCRFRNDSRRARKAQGSAMLGTAYFPGIAHAAV